MGVCKPWKENAEGEPCLDTRILCKKPLVCAMPISKEETYGTCEYPLAVLSNEGEPCSRKQICEESLTCITPPGKRWGSCKKQRVDDNNRKVEFKKRFFEKGMDYIRKDNSPGKTASKFFMIETE